MIKTGLGAFGAFLLAILVICAIIFGGYEAHWWFYTNSTNRQAHILRDSYGSQTAVRQDLSSQIQNIGNETTQILTIKGNAAKQSLASQRYSTAQQACADAAEINGGLNVQQQQFVTANCSAGAVSSSSQYAPQQ